MLNEIVNNEMSKTIDYKIAVVEDWSRESDIVSCEAVIKLLKANRTI